MAIGAGRKPISPELCPMCGKRKIVTLAVWDAKGNCAECRNCASRFTNPEWREIRAARFGNTPAIRQSFNLPVHP